MNKNKKAILLPEGLKLMIALVCIILLIYLAYSFYQIFIAKSDLEKARANLNAIVGKIESLEIGKGIGYLLYSPRNWILISFPNIYSSHGPLSEGEPEIPKSCDKFCLCICPNVIPRAETCEERGACKDTKEKIKIYRSEDIAEQDYPLEITEIMNLYIWDNDIYKSKEIFDKR